jgi:branched-chain amino acid transport system substrate-binding protein
MFGDPKHYPWTIGSIPNYQTEAHIYAKHILMTRPDAKVGVLYQNDGLGKDYLTGLRDGVGAVQAAMIVKEISYEVSEPTIDSQIVTLQGAGVDTLIIAATDKFAAQAIRKAYDIGWVPVRYMSYTASSITATLKPAGREKSKGLITAYFEKDPIDKRWNDDPGYQKRAAFVAKYLNPADLTNANAVTAHGTALMLIQVLESV